MLNLFGAISHLKIAQEDFLQTFRILRILALISDFDTCCLESKCNLENLTAFPEIHEQDSYNYAFTVSEKMTETTYILYTFAHII